MNARRDLPLLALFVFVYLSAALAVRPTPAAAQPLPPPTTVAWPFTAGWLPRATIDAPTAYGVVNAISAQRLYLAVWGEPLRVYDLATTHLLATIPMSANGAFVAPDDTVYITAWHDADITRALIYVYEPAATNPRILPYDCRPEVPHCTISELAEGPGGRLYLAHPGGQRVDILDGQTGQLLHTFNVGSSPTNSLTLALFDATLYIGISEAGEPDPFITVYDVSDVVPALIDSLDIYGTWQVLLSPDGRTLYVDGYESFDQYHTAPLTYVRTLDGRLQDVLPNGAALATRQYRFTGFEVVAYDPQTGDAHRGLRHTNVSPRPQVYALADGGLAAFYNDRVVLHIPSDYAAALPLVPVR